jgi:hypothetical protein
MERRIRQQSQPSIQFLESTMSVFKSLAGFLLILFLAGCNINASVDIPDGSTQEGDASTVNGSVSVGDDVTVNGDVGNVNGRIRVGSNSRVGSIGNVNGSIQVGEGSTAESVEAVNGSITLANGGRDLRRSRNGQRRHRHR